MAEEVNIISEERKAEVSEKIREIITNNSKIIDYITPGYSTYSQYTDCLAGLEEAKESINEIPGVRMTNKKAEMVRPADAYFVLSSFEYFGPGEEDIFGFLFIDELLYRIQVFIRLWQPNEENKIIVKLERYSKSENKYVTTLEQSTGFVVIKNGKKRLLAKVAVGPVFISKEFSIIRKDKFDLVGTDEEIEMEIRRLFKENKNYFD